MIVGSDNGRKNVKQTDGNGETIIFPSYVIPAREVDLDFDFSSNNISDILDNLKVTIDDKDYFVGNLAMREGATLDFEKEKASQNTKPLLLTAIALQAKSEYVCPYIIMGLPISDYKSQGKTIQKHFAGEHLVRLPNKTVNIEIVPSQIRAFPEGAGAAWNLLLDDRGNVQRPELATGNIGIVDIGRKTCNFLMLRNMKFDDINSATLPYGISFILKRFYKRLANQGSYTMAEAEDLLETNGQEELKYLAKIIKDEISIFWQRTEEMKIFLCGGGGKLISPFFDIAHTLVDDPIEANSRGFAKVAKATWL